ncbi:MAG: hypothetical protein OXG98_08185 [Gemmatimonadetes bacterium]|nr:hypothetical protein [Gemmatimonadota bacterium]
MKRIEGLVIGSRQDSELYREDIERRDGVVFALPNGGSKGGAPGGGNGAVRSLETARDALRAYLPRQALFLSPYRDMAADAANLLENGVDVRSAGPLPFRSREPGIPITDIHRADPGFPAMLEASRHADFGEPVYLRLITSPEGGKWQKWWCVFQSCRKAAALLDSPLCRVYVAAAGTAPRLHVSITLKTDRSSTGHLLVAPNGSRLQDDLFLVGTGGTLADDPLLNQPGMYGKSDYRMLTRPTRRRLADLWGNEALVTLTAAERHFYHELLRAIGDSSRSRSGICLEYPAA